MAKKRMKKETRSWLMSFMAGFLATILGIFLTFGVDSIINSRKRVKTARLLAQQVLVKMDNTYYQLHEYQDIYDTIDSLSMKLHQAIMADTLEKVDLETVDIFLGLTLSEYVQVDVDGGVEAYKSEILNNIGNVELLGHIDNFYSYARQHAAISSQVISQKRIVSDLFYSRFYGDTISTDYEGVRFLHNLEEFNIYYSRMQNVRASLQQASDAMQNELDACHAILQ